MSGIATVIQRLMATVALMLMAISTSANAVTRAYFEIIKTAITTADGGDFAGAATILEKGIRNQSLRLNERSVLACYGAIFAAAGNQPEQAWRLMELGRSVAKTPTCDQADKFAANGQARALPAARYMVSRWLAKPDDVDPGEPSASAVQVASAPLVSAPAPSASVSIAAPRRTGPRVALIVANARYTPVLGALPNPANDGRLVAGALRAAGFQVEVVTDADQRTMKQAIARLGQRLGAAGRGATGLFYYAGHGVQSKGVNYLMPVNAEPRVEADVDLDGVAADTVLRQLEDAGATTSIVILDACRDMPLAKASRSAARGLARMDAPGNSYLVYSTAPGQTAADGDGANSPFATAVAAEMGKPNQPIEMVFRNVRRAVLAATANRQTPWVTESLSESFVFTPR